MLSSLLLQVNLKDAKIVRYADDSVYIAKGTAVKLKRVMKMESQAGV